MANKNKKSLRKRINKKFKKLNKYINELNSTVLVWVIGLLILWTWMFMSPKTENQLEINLANTIKDNL